MLGFLKNRWHFVNLTGSRLNDHSLNSMLGIDLDSMFNVETAFLFQ